MKLKERILEYEDSGLSYNKIAEILECSKSTVSLYLGKKFPTPIKAYGEEHPHYNKLKEMVEEGALLGEIAESFGRSRNCIREWLKRCNLVLQGRPFKCQYCGETNQDNFYKCKNKKHKSNCKNCHNENRNKSFQDKKIKAIGYKGGECQKCGYNKNYAALDFHHLEPDEKDIDFNNCRCWSWKRLRKELDKCQLLCSNCHRELHNPDCTF